MISELVDRFVARVDSFQNLVTGLGVSGKDASLNTRFKRRDVAISRDEIKALYEQQSIFARIIDLPAEHATRRWIEIKGGDEVDGFGQLVLDGLEALKAQDRIYNAYRLDRLDGGSVIVMGVDDGQDVAEPLNLDRVQRLDYLTVLSRYEAWPENLDMNPLSPTYRQPTFWRFSSAGSAVSQAKVHASRVIRFSGIQTTEDAFLARQGWGLPVPERIYDDYREFGSVFGYAAAMFKNLYQGVLTIDGLNVLLSNEKGTNSVTKRLGAIAYMASALNLVLVDKSENYEQRTLSMSGVSDAMVRTMDKLAASSEMPLSILFGQAPTGLSTDDKGGRTTYYDAIASRQRRDLMDPLSRIATVMCRAKQGPTKGKLPARWRIVFRPLEEPSETEIAQNRMTNASADEKLIMSQVISPDEARTRLSNDAHSPYTLEAGSTAPVPDPTIREAA